MLNDFCYIFLLFMIYSFLGYLSEILSCSIREGKLVLNRGFCLGPYLPIYGISCILMGSFIIRYKDDFFTVFVMSAFVCSVVEYITSYVLEKIFKARWWDYSDRKFNLDGRVCLFNSFLFGIGGVLFTYLINPITIFLVSKLSFLALRIISLTLLLIFVIDIIITITTLCQVKISTVRFKNKDATAEITNIIREELFKKKDIKRNFFIRHMLNAFPQINISDYTNPLSRVKRYNIKGIKKKQK